MVREIAVSELTENLAQMCIKANHVLSGDMDRALKCAVETEESPLGTKILNSFRRIFRLRTKSAYRSVRTPEWW